ncbi:MAG: acyl-CoA thioesterase [Rikenellaceae bacterium]|nr:acyl-CoA thioesterase [Rikenellaceae bacterium]MCL2692350.1 acyl-CoA thioesterase [Rikenellaceae bacterium]
MKKTETDIQIRFADIDILGHVNNVCLQHYFDLGKSMFYRDILGIEMMPGGGREFPITAATETSYFAQTRFDEPIYVETRMPAIGNKSMTVAQRIISRTTCEVKAESRSVMVAFDFVEQTSIPVPESWRSRLFS